MSSSQAYSQTMSQSQALSQSRQGSEILDQAEKDKKVNELVQYMLVMDQKKVPIKRRDINRVVLKGQNKTFLPVMEEASSKLLEVYGFKVVELQDKMKDSYILVNAFDLTETQLKFIKVSQKDSAEMGLLYVILGMIFMNGNKISEDDMWHALKKLGICQDEMHDTFGNVKNLIMKEFVRKAYLHTERNSNTDPPTSDISWGQRAEHEITKRNMLGLVSSVYGTEPEDWIHQMKQVEEEQERLQQQMPEFEMPGPSSAR